MKTKNLKGKELEEEKVEHTARINFKNGKRVSIGRFTKIEMIDIAKTLIRMYGDVHPGVKAELVYTYKHDLFVECDHCGTLEEAIGSLQREKEFEREYRESLKKKSLKK